MPARPRFKEEVQSKVIHNLLDAMRCDLESRSEWVNKRVRSFDDWLNPNQEVKSYPWEGASNVTPPLIAKAARALHARILASIFNADPIVHVLPVDSQNMEAARVREKFLNEQVRNEIPDFYREINTALMDMIIQGTSFIMAWFERVTETIPEWHLVEKFSVPFPGEEVRRLDEEVIAEVLMDVESVRSLGDHTYRVRHLDSSGFERVSMVRIDWDDPEAPEDRASVVVEKESTVEATRIKNLNIEDLVFPANATSLQTKDCHHVFRLLRLYKNQIRERFQEKVFFNLTEEDVERLERLSSSNSGSNSEGLPQDVNQVQQAVDAFQGIDLIDGTSGSETDKVLIVECFYPWDANGDGIDEQMIFYWIPTLNKLASWEYANVRFGHGRRPFVPFVFTPITGRLYGVGLAEMLEDLQEEAGTIFNQMNDRENLINHPLLLVEMNAGISPIAFRNLPPGSALPVRDVERVRPLEWAKDAHSGIPVLQQIYAFAEQIAGVGDISSGVQPNRPNAPRTARGTLALISESNIIVDTHVLNTQYISFQELITQIDGLNRQYLPDEKIFFVVGERDPLTINKQDLHDRVKFYFSGNTTNTNTQVKQSLAEFQYTSLSTNPLYSGAYIQMPPLAIKSLYSLTEFYIREHNAGKDARFLLPPLQEFLQAAEESQMAQLQGMQEGKAAAEQQMQQQAMAQMQTGGGGMNGGSEGPPSGGQGKDQGSKAPSGLAALSQQATGG